MSRHYRWPGASELPNAHGSSAPTLRYITVSPQTSTISVTTTQQYSALAYYSDGSVKDGTSLVSWSSSNTAVATITGFGVATGVAPGTVTITGTAAGTSGATATLNVNQLTKIVVTPATWTLPAGVTKQFTATGTFTNPDGSTGTSDVTSLTSWSSSNTAVATIDNTGLATGVGLTGSATITAALNGITGTAVVTAGAPVPVSLQVTPTTQSVAVGGAVNFTAMEVWSDNSKHTPSGTVTWTSGTPATATIVAGPTNGTEIAAALAVGSTVITATESSLPSPNATATLTVMAGVTRFAYIANQNDNTIEWYQVSAAAATPLTGSQVTTAPTFANSQAPAQTIVHPTGNFLYAVDTSSYLHVMTINPSTGAPSAEVGSPILAGAGNLNYGVIDPYGRFIYVSDDLGNTIYGFKIDPVTGALTQIGSGAAATTNLNQPEQIIIDRTGTYMYASNFIGNTISSYSINQSTGALTPLTTIATGSGPFFGTLDPSGTHLFVANSVDETVSTYTIGTGGALTAGTPFTVTGAVSIGNVAVAPSGNAIYVLDAGASTGTVYAFSLSGATIGSAIGTPAATGGAPFGMAIDVSGVLLAVVNSLDGTTSLYTIASDGSLTAKSPATVAAGSNPEFISFYNAAQ